MQSCAIFTPSIVEDDVCDFVWVGVKLSAKSSEGDQRDSKKHFQVAGVFAKCSSVSNCLAVFHEECNPTSPASAFSPNRSKRCKQCMIHESMRF